VFWPVTNHKLGRSIVFWPVTNHKLDCNIQRCYDQVYDFLLVRTLYATTKFMICYRSKHGMLWPSLWFVTGQNTVCYDQVYDLLLVRTLYGMTKFMICYWSEHCMVWPSLWFITGQHTAFWPVTNHKLGRSIQCSDQ
jgi:hypothetical protein